MPNVTKAELAKLEKRNEKIIALYKKGASGTVIAKLVGLSSPMVYMIIKKAGASRSETAKKAVVPVKKSPAKKTPAKKSSPQESPAKKGPAPRKAATPVKAAKKAPARKPSAKAAAPKILAVIKTRGRPRGK